MKIKHTLPTLTLLLTLLSTTICCTNKNSAIIDMGVNNAASHLALMVDSLDAKDKIMSPRTFQNGKIVFHNLQSWTSGFFPGSLWYLYEMTGDNQWKDKATKYTEGMEHIKNFKGNHDIGFMIFCSFGNALRLTEDSKYENTINTAAETLMERYNDKIGVIQSWNKSKKWDYPVIIDNMMNLELLFEAAKLTGNKKYSDAAISHADVTMKNHYRPDNSCYHVIDYDVETGDVRKRNTHQGYADESSWSRGQAWGLYGYTLCYRYTKDEKYLIQAEKIADFIFNNPTLPSDLVPYWDYNVPNIENESRDVSAAAVTASALYELSQYSSKGDAMIDNANSIIETLTSDEYTAKVGENGHFLLLHSVGSKPHNAEYDAPLVYADYYYLEALKRKRDLGI